MQASGPDADAIEARLQARGPRMQEQMASAASRERQEPRCFELVSDEDLREFATDEEDFEFLRSLGSAPAVTVELRARGRPTGMLTISVGPSGRRFRAGDVHFVTSSPAASPWPSTTPASSRTSSAASANGRRSPRPCSAACCRRRCRTSPAGRWRRPTGPAGAENEIGGDFYDAFRIAGGWMVVIGDVTGRGAQAAAVTAHARYTLRTAAALTGDPVVALRTLNRELLARRGTALCSVAAMAISEDPHEPVRLAVAGHPPPLLVDGDR